MLGLLHGFGKNKELELLMQEVDSNIANNYKDAAQEAFACLEQKFQKLCDANVLKEKQQAIYQQKIDEYRNTLHGFTHKDQKPYWHS